MKVIFKLQNEQKYLVEANPNETLATTLGRLFESNKGIMGSKKFRCCVVNGSMPEIFHTLNESGIQDNDIILIINNEMDVGLLLKNTFGFELKEDEKGLYFGGIKTGKKDGLGTYFYKNGDIYTGKWKNDKYNGFGYNFLNNGEFFVGDFKDNKKNGKILGKKQGDILYCDYKNDIKDGEGFFLSKISNDGGDLYFGLFKNDTKNGRGYIHFKDGTRYEGDFANGTYCGKGIYKYNEGYIYEGGFNHGEKNGPGILTKYKIDKIIDAIWENGHRIKN